MEIALIILSISIFLLIFLCLRLSSDNSSLKSELKKLKDSISNKNKTIDSLKNQLTSIKPGDKALLPNWALKTMGEKPINFTVTYEIDIVDVSLEKVKIRATDYTSDDRFAKDPKNKQSIINFMQDQWVYKNKIDLIVDDSDRRNLKIDQILS